GARNHRHVGKCSVAVVVVKNTGRAVARDIDVGPAVIVEVEGGDTEGVVSAGLINLCFRSDVLELAMAQVAVEDILGAGQSARATHHRHSLPYARRSFSWRRSGGHVKVHVVGHHQIKQTVAIVINEGASCAPGLPASRHAGRIGNLCEHPALIVIEAILRVISYVEVFPSIVVVVSYARALTPSGCGQAGLRSYIGERSVVIVAIEVIAGCGTLSRG